MASESLHYVAANYTYKKEQCAAKRSKGVCNKCHELTNETGFLHENSKPLLLRFYHPPVSADAKYLSDYYRQLLFLHLPWRDETVDLTEDEHESYQDAYNRICSDKKYATITKNMLSFEEYAAKVRRADAQIDGEDEAKDKQPDSLQTFEDAVCEDNAEPSQHETGMFDLCKLEIVKYYAQMLNCHPTLTNATTNKRRSSKASWCICQVACNTATTKRGTMTSRSMTKPALLLCDCLLVVWVRDKVNELMIATIISAVFHHSQKMSRKVVYLLTICCSAMVYTKNKQLFYRLVVSASHSSLKLSSRRYNGDSVIDLSWRAKCLVLYVPLQVSHTDHDNRTSIHNNY